MRETSLRTDSQSEPPVGFEPTTPAYRGGVSPVFPVVP